MRELVNGGWDYTLFEDGDRLILSVPSGGVAMFEVNVVLSDDEAATYRAQGIDGLQPLIREMRLKPKGFQSRQIRLPPLTS